LQDIKPTEEKTLVKAAEIAKKAGLNYVYIGNIEIGDWENTYCPKCGKILIERQWFNVISKKNKCDCGEKIKGVW
jgi:pyruvate formate lyase activating enzyme